MTIPNLTAVFTRYLVYYLVYLTNILYITYKPNAHHNFNASLKCATVARRGLAHCSYHMWDAPTGQQNSRAAPSLEVKYELRLGEG